MSKRIFPFELNGQEVLGFDTGLDERSFAQAKLARLLTGAGFVVKPDGAVENWLPCGISETETMIFWGPLFPGEELADIINSPNRKDEALNGLRFWLKAVMVPEKNSSRNEAPVSGPEGIFITTREQPPFPPGTVFFPPARLLQCTRKDEPANTTVWTHPDLNGNEAISFCAGIILYRIFCGVHPFLGTDIENIHRDMREENFIPSGLAAPGLDPEMADLIDSSIGLLPRGVKKAHPLPDFILDFVGPPSSRPVSSWQREISAQDAEKIRMLEEQYKKRTALKVKARRFVIRNTAIIAALIIAAAVLLFIIRGFEKRRSDLPGTAGMNPVQVARTYYNSFSALDHAMMDACVKGGAGKQDIHMATSLYVVTKTREAYELSGEIFLPALRWIAEGRPATDRIVFGITDLIIEVLSEEGEKAVIEASYVLWMPSEGAVEGQALKDTLDLVYSKGLWRITKIDRSL